MPSTKYVKQLMLGDSDTKVQQMNARVDKRDLELVQQVFPETGLSTYLNAFVFRLLADHLREHGVVSMEERHKCKLKNIQDIPDHVCINKRRKSTTS